PHDPSGPHARAAQAREVVLKTAARHDQKEALALLGREIAPMATGGVVGMSGSFGPRRRAPSPVIRIFSCLGPKAGVPVPIEVDGRQTALEPASPPGGFHAG